MVFVVLVFEDVSEGMFYQGLCCTPGCLNLHERCCRSVCMLVDAVELSEFRYFCMHYSYRSVVVFLQCYFAPGCLQGGVYVCFPMGLYVAVESSLWCI